MVRETRDVDDSLDSIKVLSPHVMGLRSKVIAAAEAQDMEVFKGLARLLAEAGESWVIVIAREPAVFRPLIEAIYEVCSRDWEREAIGYTFHFWEDLKLWLVMDRYYQAKELFTPIMTRLVDEMISHLQYPKPEGSEDDLFDGDREQEDRFRNYRHEIGNVLKDCCEVLGAEDCLASVFNLIEAWVEKYGSQATAAHIPNWQGLEAQIFALRAMGLTVPVDENVMLPRLIPLLVQIPDHEKIRYQAVMTLGRYTEWTANHPETLDMQLQFIMAAFKHPSKEVVRGATHSFQYFCLDCAELLKGFFGQIHQFYESVIDDVPLTAQGDVTEGMAAILAKQPVESLYDNMKLCCDPILQRVIELGRNDTDEKAKFLIPDKLDLITIFIEKVHPFVEPNKLHPAVKYCQEILPILAALAEKFRDFPPVLEKICRCWRHMVLSYRTAAAPMLPDLASKLVAGFSETRQGCFLWATDSIVREFSEHAEGLDPNMVDAVVPFFEQQASTFLRALSEVDGQDLPDLIEDFFRLTQDVLLHHTNKGLHSPLMGDILAAACHSLSLLKLEVLMMTLHFLRDFIVYGTSSPPSSRLNDDHQTAAPEDIQVSVKRWLVQQGQPLTQRVLTGMMYSFPEDCIPDASGVLLDMLRVLPQETAMWIGQTLSQLPENAIRPREREKLISQLEQ